MTLKIMLHVLEALWSQENEAANFQQKRSPEIMPNPEPDVVADNRPHCRRQHHPKDIEMVRMAGRKVTADEQNGLARRQQPRILQHDAKEDGPIAIREHVLLNKGQQIVEKIHSRN